MQKNKDGPVQSQQQRWDSLGEKKSSKKDQVDPLRTIFWYRHIRASLGLVTAYQVEQAMEQRLFGERGRIKNKWSKYEQGEHVPKPELVAQVDRVFPGSARALNHPLWESLRVKRKRSISPDGLLLQLAPAIQGVIFDRKSAVLQRQQPSYGRLERLRKNASLDSLAGLVLLLQDRSQVERDEVHLRIGQSIYIVLLMLVVADMLNECDKELFHLVQVRVFPLAEFDGRGIHASESSFFERVELLKHTFALNENETGKAFSAMEKISLLHKMSSGRLLPPEQTYELFNAVARLQ